MFADCMAAVHVKFVPSKIKFDALLMACRRVIENSYGRNKGRWRVLKAARLRDPRWFSMVTRVCCALHNICTIYNCPFDEAWFPKEKPMTGDPWAVPVSSSATLGATIRFTLVHYARSQGYY